MTRATRSLPFFITLALAIGCAGTHQHKHNEEGRRAVAVIKPSAAATTQPTNSNVTGVLTIVDVHHGVRITGELSGLTPGLHGFHVHELADMSDPNLQSVGPHFNPKGHKHGGADTEHRHAGDMGNITANDKGVAVVDIEVKGVTLKEGAECIVGRSIIVHAKADDLATDPAGNSGGRIAGGVIELKK